jgi:hypothetical protein
MNKTMAGRRIGSAAVATLLGWVIVLGAQTSAEAMQPPPDDDASSTTVPADPKPGEHQANRPVPEPTPAPDEPKSGKRPTDAPKPGEHQAKRPVPAPDKPKSGKRPTDDPKPGEHQAKRPIPVPEAPTLPAKAKPPTAFMSAYLSQSYQLIDPCPGTYGRIVRSDNHANPDTWHDSAKFERTDGDGIFITAIYRQIGVTRYDHYESCTQGSNHQAMETPTAYAHRLIRNNYACVGEGAGCSPILPFTQTGPWTPGA